MTIAMPGSPQNGIANMGGPDAEAAPGGPAAGQMATPQKKLGEMEKAKATIQIAVKVLTMSLAAFEPMGPEAKSIMDAIKTLSKSFGKTEHEAKELVPAEISQLMSGMKPPGGAPQGGPPGKPPGAM